MFSVIRNAFKTPDLRKRLLYTMMILIFVRLGSALPVPYVDASTLVGAFDSGTLFGFADMMSGGAFSSGTLFALSITPYINSSIIIQLLAIAIPALERLSKEGPEGRKKLNRISRYLTVVLALVQAIGFYFLLKQYNAIVYKTGFDQWFSAIIIVLSFTAGAALLMWLGERISQKGIGNGISMILFAGIIARGPQAFNVLWETFKLGKANYFLVPLALIIFLLVIVFIIVMTNAERRIPVQYAKRVVGRKMYGGQSSFIPVKVNLSGVLPVIFASAFLSIPQTIGMFVTPEVGSFGYNLLYWLSSNGPIYAVLYFLLIIAFNYFYVSVQYNPVEIANNIKSNNGAIPGIRPGRPTVQFISKVVSKITLIGALFLAVVAVFPILFSNVTSINVSLGGTSIIILVGVALDTMRQLESNLTVHHHKGFLE